MTFTPPPRRPRSAAEAELLGTARRLLPSGVRTASANPEYAMVVASARGARLTDASGNEYVDYLLGSGPLLLGHGHPAVTAAIRDQLERGTGYLLVNEPAIRLAEALVELVPCAEAVTFHNTGSEAIFFALRLARAARGRDAILKFEGAYHGMSDHALMSTQWTRSPAPFPEAVPSSRGIPASVPREMVIAPFNDVATTTALIEEHADRLAAVIVEPLQRTIPPAPGFLAELRRVTARHGIVLIFDEVVTGFRLALGGAQEHYGVTPDLCALGKSISAGLPLGVVCGRRDLMALADPERREHGDGVLLTGTYSGNAVICGGSATPRGSRSACKGSRRSSSRGSVRDRSSTIVRRSPPTGGAAPRSRSTCSRRACSRRTRNSSSRPRTTTTTWPERSGRSHGRSSVSPPPIAETPSSIRTAGSGMKGRMGGTVTRPTDGNGLDTP
jgi:glutamate-1-semialdehyde 2,1-aminomutase